MDPDFETSKLGTKEYWDSAYDKELTNFKEDGDIGEVWFGEMVLSKLVNFIVTLTEDEGIDKNTPILDIGCGNGSTCLQLAEEGFVNLTGTDYSASAISLAKEIAEKDNIAVEYCVDDILNSTLIFQDKRFQIVVDKGTFDAISLSENRIEAQQRYIQFVKDILDKSKKSFFVVTSCNFVKEELLNYFQTTFKYHSQIKYPTFQFGGKEGSVVTSLAFTV